MSVRGNTIGSRIEKLRKEKGLTQSELAKAMGVKRETVVQWESNTRDLKTVATIKLADFFNVSCDYILRGVKTENLTAHKELGLSDAAVERLRYINKMDKYYPSALDNKPVLFMPVINAFIEDEDFTGTIPPLVSTAIIDGSYSCGVSFVERQQRGGHLFICQEIITKIIDNYVKGVCENNGTT